MTDEYCNGTEENADKEKTVCATSAEGTERIPRFVRMDGARQLTIQRRMMTDEQCT